MKLGMRGYHRTNWDELSRVRPHKGEDACPRCGYTSRRSLPMRNGRAYWPAGRGMTPVRENNLKDVYRTPAGTQFATCNDAWHTEDAKRQKIDARIRYAYRFKWAPRYAEPDVETPATTVNLHGDPDKLRKRKKQKNIKAKKRRSKDRK